MSLLPPDSISDYLPTPLRPLLLQPKLGGLAAYQAVSLRSEAAGSTNTSRWVVKQLQKLGLHRRETREAFLRQLSAGGQQTCAQGAAPAPSSSLSPEEVPATAATAAGTGWARSPQDGAGDDDHRLALLDVGALAANYTSEASWISARAIDLNAQTPAVARVDFFDEPLSPQLGVLSLCLVLNFVGDPRRAGQMLWKASVHLKPGGLLAVMVPRACVDNSRYCTDTLFQQALESAGFEVAVVDHSARLARYLARRRTTGPHEGTCPATLPKGLDKRTVVRSGGQRNNFCILLEPRWVPGGTAS